MMDVIYPPHGVKLPNYCRNRNYIFTTVVLGEIFNRLVIVSKKNPDLKSTG